MTEVQRSAVRRNVLNISSPSLRDKTKLEYPHMSLDGKLITILAFNNYGLLLLSSINENNFSFFKLSSDTCPSIHSSCVHIIKIFFFKYYFALRIRVFAASRLHFLSEIIFMIIHLTKLKKKSFQ